MDLEHLFAAAELPHTMPVACRLPTATALTLRAAAKARGVTVNDLLRPMLEALAETVAA
jgi:hypothetical protein